MAENNQNGVSDMVKKFKQTTQELGYFSEAIIIQLEDVDAEKNCEWDCCLIGKIIIKGKMIYQTVLKNLKFTWPFISQEEVQNIEMTS